MNQITVNTSVQVSFNQEQVAVIKNQIAKDATDMELKSFIYQCERTGLDPFSRQIYFIKSGGKVQIQTSIDGLRLIAERSDKYEGQTQAMWCGTDGVWKDIWVSKEFPVASKIGVYKKGFREPLYAIAHWNEYYPTAGYMQKKMPALMIAKVAESLALRKAFPNEMSGLYTQEEMVQTPEPKQIKSVQSVVAVKPIATVKVGEAVIMDSDINAEFDSVSQSDFDTFQVPQQSELITPTETTDFNPNYVCEIGKKYVGQTLDQMGVANVDSYKNYLLTSSQKDGKPLTGKWLEFTEEAQKFVDAHNTIK